MISASDPFYVRKQGDLDGLCGVYSIVHGLLRFRGKDSDLVASKYFCLTLKGLKDARSLLPTKIKSGFGQGKLRQAFKYVCEAENLPYRAFPITSYAKRHRCTNILEVLRSLPLEGAVIAHLPRPQHWVLAHSPKTKSFSIDDSAEGALRRVRGNQINERKFHLKKGLVLLDAQTH